MVSAFLFVSVIGPSLSQPNFQSRVDFLLKTLRKYTRSIISSATLAVGAGLFLFSYISTTATTFLPSGWGLIFLYLGAVLGLVTFILTLAVVLPSSSRLVRLLKSDVTEHGQGTRGATVTVDPMAELGNVQSTIKSGLRAVVALLILILIFMVIGANF